MFGKYLPEVQGVFLYNLVSELGDYPGREDGIR
jgi:hypothetical protein